MITIQLFDYTTKEKIPNTEQVEFILSALTICPYFQKRFLIEPMTDEIKEELFVWIEHCLEFLCLDTYDLSAAVSISMFEFDFVFPSFSANKGSIQGVYTDVLDVQLDDEDSGLIKVYLGSSNTEKEDSI